MNKVFLQTLNQCTDERLRNDNVIIKTNKIVIEIQHQEETKLFSFKQRVILDEHCASSFRFLLINVHICSILAFFLIKTMHML